MAEKKEGKRKLTPKQKRFAKLVPISKSQEQAAILAGYSPKSARVIAHQNMRKADVVAAIEKELDKAGLDDEAISNKLKYIIDRGVDNASNSASPSDSLRGLDMVLKLKDRYPAAKEVKTSFNLSLELREKTVQELQGILEDLEYRQSLLT